MLARRGKMNRRNPHAIDPIRIVGVAESVQTARNLRQVGDDGDTIVSETGIKRGAFRFDGSESSATTSPQVAAGIDRGRRGRGEARDDSTG